MAPSPRRGPRRSRSRKGWRRGLLRSGTGLTDRNSKVDGPNSAQEGPAPGSCSLSGMAEATSPGSRNHVVVMGAGPAGLSAAYELTRHGTSVTVVEKDPRQVGGIARIFLLWGGGLEDLPYFPTRQ